MLEKTFPMGQVGWLGLQTTLLKEGRVHARARREKLGIAWNPELVRNWRDIDTSNFSLFITSVNFADFTVDKAKSECTPVNDNIHSQVFIVQAPFMHRVILEESHRVSGPTDSALVPQHHVLVVQLARRLSPHQLVPRVVEHRAVQ